MRLTCAPFGMHCLSGLLCLYCGPLFVPVFCLADPPTAEPKVTKQVRQVEIAAAAAEPDPSKDAAALFDGKSLQGWNGSQEWFRIEEGCIVGGSLQRPVPRNEFLEWEEELEDFELTLQFKVLGDQTNSGIQIRSQRIPDHHEMKGYQADLGPGYWGALYDESRRNKVLEGPEQELVAKILKPGEWNEYKIVCQGPRIQLFLNGEQTVDYTEADTEIPRTGRMALQIHGGPPGEVWFKEISLRRGKAGTAE